MTTGHRHAGFETPPGYTDPQGRGVNTALLGQLLGAAVDGCTTCQAVLLTLLVEDAASTARLIELACVATHSLLGGLPASLTDPAADGPTSPEFRELAAAGLNEQNTALFDRCAQMSTTQRHAAATTAADILTGLLATDQHATTEEEDER